MDRFIEKNQIFRPDCRVNLKSNMDRFIDSNISRAPLADYI